MFNKLKESWIYTGILSLMCFGYAAYILLADKPFFIGTKHLKHKPTEWLYENVGSYGTSIIFFLLGVLFVYWCINDFKK